jgi:hypothetical protein
MTATRRFRSFCCHDSVAGIDPHATFDEAALAGSSPRRMYEQDSSDAFLADESSPGS